MKNVRYLALGLIVLGVCGLWLASRVGSRSTPTTDAVGTFPGASVILVTLDTTRADRFGCYGSTAGLTPFMDQLAERGIVFDQAQATAPVTLPSHASMMTGLTPIRHGVRNNGMFSLDSSLETLAERFSEAGYATGAFVSAEVLSERYGLGQGFDIYDDDLSQGRRLSESMVAARRGDLTLQAALAWIDGIASDRPFFLWLHLYDPHAPYEPPSEYRARFPSDPYGGEIAFVDDLVRQLVERLETTDRLDRTVLSVIADHGESLGEHGERTHGILLNQATIHVPWILVPPGSVAGSRVVQPVTVADVAPVLARLAEVESPNADLLEGVATPWTRPETGERDIYYETMLPMYQYGWSAFRGLRRGAWELLSAARDELFELSQDPRQLVDLAESEPGQLEFMRGRLAAVAATDDRLDVDLAQNMRPSERQALEALGYLATTSAPRRDPPDPRDLIVGHVYVESAQHLAKAGRVEEALREIDGMLSRDPQNLAALNVKGRMLIGVGRLEEAEQLLRRGLEVDPRNSDVISGLCQLEMMRRDYGRAIELARMGRDSRSPFGVFDALEARALMNLGRDGEASGVIERAAAARPDDPDVLVVRAQLAGKQGRNDDAEADLRRAVVADPFHTPSRRELGRLLQTTSRDEEAIDVYEDLLRNSPFDHEALLALGTIMLRRDVSRSVPYLEEAARLAPGKADVLTALGVAYIQNNRLVEAEATLRRAVFIAGDDPQVRNNLGIALLRLGRYDEAEAELRPIIESFPRFVQPRNNLAIALAEQGDLVAAEKEAVAALAINPDFLDGLLTLASLQHRAGRMNDERETLEKALALAPESDDIRVKLGVAAGLADRCARSLELLEPFFSRPDELTAEAHLAAARCLEDAGRVADGLRHFEEAARKSPPGRVREEARVGVQRLSLELPAPSKR